VTSGHTGKKRVSFPFDGPRPAQSKEAYLLQPLSEFGDVLTLPLTDMKPSLDLGDESPYKLSVHGLLLADITRPCMQLHTSKRVGMELVQKVTGCKKVVVSAAVLRDELYTQGDPASATQTEKNGQDAVKKDTSELFPNSPTDGICPAPKVHLDLTPKGARYHIRKYHREVTSATEQVIEAENRLLESGDFYQGKEGGGGIPRFALFSIWRPLKPILAHLGIIDPHSPDLNVNNQRPVQNGTCETYGYLAYGPRDKEQKAHGWHFVPEQQPSDVLVIELFDNETEAHARAPQ
ncbi:hypothetical protein N7519_006420, partial [Penicillium mononematosum]|uniref:uncharacterized protein n=1 Tax=Penicillium mononematosum TaxID=268346 RepID=UPI002546893D